jgi:senataxin
LLQLSEALAHFDPVRSDEVEIVSHTQPTIPALEVSQAKTVVPRSHVPGKGQQLHPKRRSTVPTVPSHPGPSPFFSDRDQQQLESMTSMPSLRRSGISIPVPPNKQSPEISQLRGKTEAHRPLASSEESASSSDSGEEDAVTKDLANLGRFPKSPKKPRPIERRQIKTFDIPTQSNPMQDRILRNKQPKINGALRRPDVSGLHKILLSWGYNHGESTPPGEQMKLFTVPDRFDSYEHYFRVFQPLLLMECWAQLLQSKVEKQDSYQCKVDSRQYVDDWLDIDLTIAESVKKEWYLAETDIVLLRQPGHDKSIMAKIKSYKASMSGIQATIRCYVQAGAVDPGLQITTLWQISKIFRCASIA